MVATSGQAESVLYGVGKAAAALKPGSVVLLMATVGNAAVEDWARRLAATGVQIVDAPPVFRWCGQGRTGVLRQIGVDPYVGGRMWEENDAGEVVPGGGC